MLPLDSRIYLALYYCYNPNPDPSLYLLSYRPSYAVCTLKPINVLSLFYDLPTRN